MTSVTAVKTGTLRLRPSHPAGNMNHPCGAAASRSSWTGTGPSHYQNEQDYQQFVTAVRSGRLEALEGA